MVLAPAARGLAKATTAKKRDTAIKKYQWRPNGPHLVREAQQFVPREGRRRWPCLCYPENKFV